jgi:aminopeptidase N
MTMIKHIILTLFVAVISTFVYGQNVLIKKQLEKETAPSTIRQEQKWWNLLYYKIDIRPDYERKYISGKNSITFSALQSDTIMQIDLQTPMRITSVTWKGKNLFFKQGKEEMYFVVFPRVIKAGEKQTITVYFEGKPKESIKPPYDNGWIWAKDLNGRPFISVACEGSGASIWLPCKDVLYDEPDNGVSFSITIPETLIAVSNGRLKKKIKGNNKFDTYNWEVKNPISNYCIIPYIGAYVNWHNDYSGLKGKLDCDFWVLDYNLSKGKNHLKQTDSILKAFEYWAGPYPFYEDGYKVVEAPMSGMEHQSALAYGNGFTNGLNGKDLISKSGWGLKFDFVLVHESAHEWFANSITTNNYGDGWIHEGFTKYFETLYTSTYFGIEAGNDYAIGTWKRIKNDEPIIGTNTSDKYYKASAMLHMIRQVIGDSLFRGLLTGLNKEFYHQTVNTNQVLSFFNNYTKTDFTKIFEQYLRTTQIPTFSYSFQNGIFKYRWENCIEDFSMPVKISFDGKSNEFIFPSTQWQTNKVSTNNTKYFQVDRNFYITVSENK